jgi:hypothetical protein
MRDAGWGMRPNGGGACSGSPARLTYCYLAGVIQLVECQLPKLDVVGSSPIARSLEVLEFQSVAVAGIRTGPGVFFRHPLRDPFDH